MVFNSFAHNQNMQPLKKRNSIYDGTTKILMDDPQEDVLVLHFKDTLPKSVIESAHETDIPLDYTIPGKGIVNNRISSLFFTRLSERRVDNHFISRLNMKEQHIRSCIPLPFHVVIHNFANQAFAKKMEITENQLLQEPIIEFYFNNQAGEHILISERHILAFGMATQEEVDNIILKCQRINDFLTGQLSAIDFNIFNISLEFGRFPSYDYYMDADILLIDEISPDTMCLYDLKSNEIWDRAAIIRCIDDNKEPTIYTELAKRLGLLNV